MEQKFHIILFKNNKKKKKLKSFVRQTLAENYYKDLLKKSSDIIFNKQFESGYDCKFNIGIVTSDYIGETIHYTDEFGRNKVINPKISENQYLLKIERYNLEELIFDIGKNKRITFSEFLKTYLNHDKILMISKLKNKFIVQNDDDYKLFSLKNEEDCDRFLDILFNNNPRKNLIIVKDISTIHRKYLYEILEEKGFTRKQLYTSFTTYPK